jgi:hypothetical protein
MEEALKIFGGTAVVLCGLFCFLGKILFERIIKRETAIIEKQLIEFKNDYETSNKKLQAELDATNTRLKATLEKSIYVDKVHFDYEYQIYQNIWDALIDVRMATMRLRPTLDAVDPDEDPEERRQKRNIAFSKSFTVVRDLIEKHKPFYCKKVYDSLIAILELCLEEQAGFEYSERKRTEYFQEARKNQKAIQDLVDKSCEVIRERFNELSVL